LGGLSGVLALSGVLGQTPPPRKIPAGLPATEVQAQPAPVGAPAIRPVTGTAPIDPKTPATASKPTLTVAFDRFRNLEALPEMTRQAVMSALAGMRWLNRYNQENGLFLHGYLPAVNQ